MFKTLKAHLFKLNTTNYFNCLKKAKTLTALDKYNANGQPKCDVSLAQFHKCVK